MNGTSSSCGPENGGGESLDTLGRPREDRLVGSSVSSPVLTWKAIGKPRADARLSVTGGALIVGGAQSGLKLTMCLPGLSLMPVGIGSFALRSLNLILVAARSSSDRISTLSFICGADGAVSSGALVESFRI